MSPTLPPPPPAGIHTPTDDWTDDPSFDLSLSPSLAQGILLPASPPPHSRSHSHSSSSSSRRSGDFMSSPLRHVHTPKIAEKGSIRRSGIQEEAEEDGFDFPEDLDVGREGTLKRASMPSTGKALAGLGGFGNLRKPVVRKVETEDADFPDDLELDDADGGTFKAIPTALAKPGRKGMGTIGLSGTVIGVGPKGIGTITRLGPAVGTAQAKPSVAKTDFDLEDLDDFFDGAGPALSLPSTRLSLTKAPSGLVLPPPSKHIAPPNALDDLDFDFDDGLDDAIMAEEEDQATLKAGATIKALLPPPRPKSTSAAPLPQLDRRAEDDAEMDLVLPLSMTNLTLATASTRAQSSNKLLKPRASTSTIRSDWDSPSSGSNPGSASKAIWDDSPWGKRPRPSETSGTTSISEDIGTPHRKGRAVEVEVEGEEEGEEMMLGLVLPEQGFFEGRREGELNRILDRKRKPQEAFVSAGEERRGWGKRTGPEDGKGLDESMEDGLLFDDPGKELTGHRLRQQKKVRGLAGGTVKKGSLGKESGRGSSAAGSWEKAREAGWGRHTPLPSTSREKERGSGGLGLAGMSSTGVAVGHRSHSATAAGIVAASPHLTPASTDFSSASAMAGFASHRPVEPPSSSRRDTDKHAQDTAPRARTHSMAPPPIPPSTPSSRLRHQKSHYQVLPPSPSPTHSLTRKQSLASLQDALTHRPPSAESARADPPASTPQKERYHSSTSRLTMGTSSSRAKARPPISAIFPRPDPHSTPSGGMYANTSASSSTSSISGLTRGPSAAGHRSAQPQVQLQSQMVVPLGGRRRGVVGGDKKRTWGDGTELEGIEDLEVDEPNTRSGSGMGSSGIGLGKPSRKGDSWGRSTVPPPKVIESEKRKKSNGGSVSKRRPRKAAGLIKHLGTVDKKKVVGDMTWNPATLRWEGNESILRDFDSPSGTPTTTSAPARPALITHYTGGVVPLPSSSSASPSASGSGLSLTASTIRIVGDMKFDPERMCWVSLGEEEPDPFADMADDEDDEGGGGATITRASGRKLVSVGQGLGVSAGSGWSSRFASESSAGGSVMSWEERVRVREVDKEEEGGEGSISEALWRECKDAEERHRKEMKGWGMGRGEMSREERRDRERREEKRLWEIRYLAMRS